MGAEGTKESADVKIMKRPASEDEVHKSKEYWEYLRYILDDCPIDGDKPENQRFGNKECAENVMKKVGIPIDDVNYCMHYMGPTLLEHQLNNLAWAPLAIRINGWRYAGHFEKDLVGKAICSGFTKPPQVCATIGESTTTYIFEKWSFKDFVVTVGVTLLIVGTLMMLYTKNFF